MPRLEEWEIKKYWEIFQGLKPTNNKLSGEQVSPVLKNSRLSQQQLSKVWELSDIDADGNLDFEEFCITMRLIFDLVNGSISEIPDSLPQWLVPSSKAHLIEANAAVGRGNNNGGEGVAEDDVNFDEELTLSDDFDWYILPTDRQTYESIYNSNGDSYGRVRFESLNGLYSTLKKVPESEVSSAWNLINPKSFETIDKDQVLVFLHILNQREHGKRIPRGVPASLRATFSKEAPSYDLRGTKFESGNNSSSSGGSKGLNGYLSQIGQGSNTRGTDFSSTEGTDWEEVRLRRELTELEGLLSKVKKEVKTDNNDLVKYEFEQLLKYKQEIKPDGDLSGVQNDVELIESQVDTLREFLGEKTKELEGLRA